ncbi:MAG: hypothetical protein WDA41_10675 [Candidatus Neomarinimicrobiota bacterium]|jgi:hypothetical protein
MTPQEKWERLNNPETLSDYGLILSENELMQFPEGREIVKAVRARQQETEDASQRMRIIGRNIAASLENVILQVLVEEKG